MAYTLPANNAVDFAFTGAAYVRPASTGADFAFGSVDVSGAAAATLGVSAAATGEHVVNTVTGTAAASLSVTGAATGLHGVTGAETAALDLSAAAAGVHGVTGAAAGTLGFSAHASGTHSRYEVRGEVRLSGILVNRRVRCYHRDSGALVAEADTVAGKFNVPTGFSAAEHYVVPIDLSPGATDWMPPVANRVTSVLAQDV